MRFATSGITVAVLLLVNPGPAICAEPLNTIEVSPLIDFALATQVVFVWRAPPNDPARRTAAIQPLIESGFEVDVNIEIDEVKNTQSASYTFSRTKVQTKVEVQKLYSDFVGATNGQGGVSTRISQFIRL